VIFLAPCACKVVLLPKGTVRPTDNLRAVKAAFYKRYVDLYGEAPLNGRHGFNQSLVPDWYSDLIGNDPYLPVNWAVKIDRFLEYRKNKLTSLLNVLSDNV
jgi:hypothetical protein